MTGVVNLITSRIDSINLLQPLSMLDLLIAIGMIVIFLFYIRRFPVFRVVLGLLLLLASSIIFFALGFTLTALVLGVVSNLIIVALPLIFAPEIRHYLEKLGRFPFLKIPKLTKRQRSTLFIREIADAVFELAEKNIGATVVIARKTGLGQTIETGVVIDAQFGSKILQNIFFPKSPLHDGAVILQNDRIVAAQCLLPISGEVKLDTKFGTRHKSGLAITKDTDAIVILVSEQRGEVSLAENGKLIVNLDRTELIEKLTPLL